MDIYIGTAGWSYKDWFGNVYPAGRQNDKSFKQLNYLACFFDMVEINSSFYRPPNLFMGKAWVKKVEHNPRFLFTAKLWQRFTHQRTPYGPAEIDQVREGIDPLLDADKLGAVLIQFPWSFRKNPQNVEWVQGIVRNFNHYPLVVELRHSTWANAETYDFLRENRVGITTIDQPVIGDSIGFNPIKTGDIGYIRMHGRNYENWFPGKDSKLPPSARYDYLYNEKEITEISERVKAVSSEGGGKTFVVQNNHPSGKAVANAIQLKAALGEGNILIPASMINEYPYLKNLGRVVDGDQLEY